MTYICPRCGAQFQTATPINQVHCPNCGAVFTPAATPQGSQRQSYGWQQPPLQSQDLFTPGRSGKSRGVAGLLAILLGTLGVHYFYLGKIAMGIVFLLVTLCSCYILGAVTAIISIIQGIMMLTMSQDEFERRFVMPEHPWF